MMIFHHRQRNISDLKLNLFINGTKIEQVTEFNFLGLMFDENLSWNSHVQKISGKISVVNGILSRLKRFVPCGILITIYNALIQPHLNYGILLWGRNSKRIHKLQKWAVRSITCSKYNAHSEPLFIKLKLLKIHDIYRLNLLKFYYKYTKSSLPNYFIGMFDELQRNHPYLTRNRERPVVARVRTTAANMSIRFSVPNEIINTHPSILEKVSTHSLNGFSSYVKQHYISKYKPLCDIENCYICNQ